jgi:hypothetical protein
MRDERLNQLEENLKSISHGDPAIRAVESFSSLLSGTSVSFRCCLNADFRVP